MKTKMKKKNVAFLGMVLCLVSLLPAMEVQNYAEEDAVRSETGVFEDDFMFLGKELSFSGEAEDVIFLGKKLDFTGKSTLGLIALGQKIRYTGEVGNGIISGGQDLEIDGVVNGNCFMGGKSIHLSDSASLNGTLFAGGATVTLDGPLRGDLYTGAGELVINNEISGDVKAYAGRIVFGENGAIKGDLTYSSKEKLSDDDLARVSGTVTIDDKHAIDDEPFFSGKAWKTIHTIFAIIFFVSFVIIGSALLFLPVFNTLEHKQDPRSFWRQSLWGLIPVLMYPALIILCFVMVVTIPFAFMLILAFVPLFFIANIIGTTLVGKYMVTKFNWHIEKRHFQFLIGAAVCFILSLIPFVNFLVLLFLSALGWGAYVSFLFKKDITVVE